MLETVNPNKTRIGEVVEFKATAWLLLQGYEVFRNVSSKGPVDLLFLNEEGKAILVDVKKVADSSRDDKKINLPRQQSDFQAKLGVKYLFYNERTDLFAWTMEEIYASEGKTYIRSTTVKKEAIKIKFGKEFKSIPEIARHYDINERSLRERHRTHPDETLEKSVELILARTKKVYVYGKQFSNRKEACKFYNINAGSVEEKMRIHGVTLEKAIQHFSDRNKRLEAKNV